MAHESCYGGNRESLRKQGRRNVVPTGMKFLVRHVSAL